MSKSTRQKARILALQIIYTRSQIGLNPTGEEILITRANLSPSYREFAQCLVDRTWGHTETIDQAIQTHLINWKQTRISDTLNALLKISACELLFFPETDDKVVFNEAIEICRAYVDEKATRICNGVLHAISQRSPEADV